MSAPRFNLKPTGGFRAVRVKGRGLSPADALTQQNLEVREAISTLSSQFFASHPSIEVRCTTNDEEDADALKLYRDMNHLSLAGGITCEQVMQHAEATTVVLVYHGADAEGGGANGGGASSSSDGESIVVTAATFSLRHETMMLRLLATHPRMTRKGFARITVHFLKELCRALRRTEILVYTYPSSSPFYKAMHFRHTATMEVKPAASCMAGATADAAAAAPPPAPLGKAAPDGTQPSREAAAREARRIYSAQDNEMICYVQPTMQQVVDEGLKHTDVNPYAITRKRGGNPRYGDDDDDARPPPGRRGGGGGGGPSGGGSGPSSGGRDLGFGDARAGRPSAAAGQRGQANGGGGGGGGGGAPSSGGRKRAAAAAEAEQKRGAWLAAVAPPLIRGTKRTERSAARERGVIAKAAAARGRAAEYPAEGDGSDEPTEPVDGPRRKQQKGPPKDVYQVERIVGSRTAHGEAQYLIKWKGWGKQHNTWEPLSHLRNLQADIDAYEASR